MDKALRDYIKTMEHTLTRWERKAADANDIRRTYRHHQVKVRDFQHERLIHLLVTLFFGFLCLFGLVTLFFSLTSTILSLSLFASLLVLTLFTTELFYIRHYYILENGVQKLYGITDRLNALIP